MSVLVDSSVWIEYFRGGNVIDAMDWLIDENLIVTNDLVLAEILPPLHIKRQHALVSLLGEIPLLPLEIDWKGIVQLQVKCLANGINKVGVPDLIIAQNAMQKSATLFSLDKHFRLLAGLVPLSLH